MSDYRSESASLNQFPAPYVPAYSSPKEGVSTATFVEILRHVRRRKLLIGSVTLLISAAALVVLLAMTPRYTANAIVKIESSPKHLLPVVNKETPADKQMLWANIAAESERMVSWPLLSQLAERLDLDQDPELNPRHDDSLVGLWSAKLKSQLRSVLRPLVGRQAPPDLANSELLERIARNLSSRVDTVTGLMHVSFTSHDAERAANVANMLTQLYIDDDLTRQRNDDQKLVQWLSTTVGQLQRDATTAKRAVADYKAHAAIYAVGGQSTASSTMGRMNDSLAGALADEAGIASRLAQVKAAGSDFRKLQNLPEVMQSPVIQELRKIQANLTTQLASLEQRRASTHPLVEGMRAQVGNAEAAIRREVDRVTSSLIAQGKSAQERTENLREQLRSSEKQVVVVNQAELKLSELEDIARARDSIYQAFLTRTNELSAQLGSDLQKVSIVSPARVPSRPSFPQVTLIEMFVVFASFVATSLVVVARELHDRGFATVEEIERQHKVRCIGIMPSLARDKNGQYKINEGVGVLCLNMLNAIWSRLCRVEHDEKSNVFMVTSSVPEEGKTTTVLAVARTGARHGARVLVVDCDLIRGDLTQRVKANNAPGLGEVLRGRADWRHSLVKDPVSSVDVLASGAIGEQLPSLDVPIMTTLLEEARKEYDLVLLDAPPVLGLWDAECLSRLSDATIMLVRWRKTPQRVFANALRNVSGGPVFCLLSRVDLRQYSLFDAKEFLPLMKAYNGRRLAMGDKIAL